MANGPRSCSRWASPGSSGTSSAVELAFTDTISFWRAWIGQSTYRGRWREVVDRSAITLKLLTYLPTGAVVAAPTTSLPEHIGGPRNWDYRFCWLRDSAFTMFAFLRLGFREEAYAYMTWLHGLGYRGADGPPFQVMYTLDGHSELAERELPHLSGYRDSHPVRIGNGAADQLQMDVYGEVIDAVYLAERGGMPLSYTLWVKLRSILDWLAENWDQPDEGIWEVRGGRRDFTYSRIMTWVAFDRAIRIQAKRGLPADTPRWRLARDAAYEWVMTHGWSEARQSFNQYADSDVLDASVLILPLVLMIAPTDPRMLSTLDAIREELVSDSFVFRYDPEEAADDGLPGREGSFSLCSFWYVECLTRAGRLDEARLVFEKMLGYANHLGPLLRGDRRERRRARQLPAGVHAPGPDLGRLRPRPRARRRAPRRAAQPSDDGGQAEREAPERRSRARGRPRPPRPAARSRPSRSRTS